MEAKLNKKLGYTAVMCSKPIMASNCYKLKSMIEVIGLCDPNSAPTTGSRTPYSRACATQRPQIKSGGECKHLKINRDPNGEQDGSVPSQTLPSRNEHPSLRGTNLSQVECVAAQESAKGEHEEPSAGSRSASRSIFVPSQPAWRLYVHGRVDRSRIRERRGTREEIEHREETNRSSIIGPLVQAARVSRRPNTKPPTKIAAPASKA
jgi:hypothetical protein